MEEARVIQVLVVAALRTFEMLTRFTIVWLLRLAVEARIFQDPVRTADLEETRMALQAVIIFTEVPVEEVRHNLLVGPRELIVPLRGPFFKVQVVRALAVEAEEVVEDTTVRFY
jgi:hypothetical protein